MSSHAYKRSWKNLLLNKRYQLRFTLFMVGVSAVLMCVLGWWVMRVANEATTVAMSRVIGQPCPKVPDLTEDSAGSDSAVPMKLDDKAAPAPAPDPATTPPAAPAPAPSAVDPSHVAKHNAHSDLVKVQSLWCDVPAQCKPATAEPLIVKAPHCDAYVQKKLGDPASVEALRKATIAIVRCDGGQTFTVADAAVEPEGDHHVTVQIDESSMTLTPTVPNDYADRIVQRWTCELRQAGDVDALTRGRRLILWVLLATGTLLSVGLAIYGIKMTHKVAGPLFKVSLYLAKMREGRFDKVYNLRKGDQLVDFYEHFKTAHAGVVALERDDIARIKEIVAAAEAAGAGDHEAIGELKKVLARKEKSLE
jgi:hypothetical protein